MSILRSQLIYNDRLIAAMLFIACAGLLSVACVLHPAPGGVGTHTQLGLPACGLLQVTGMPCATCGMTTAFSYAAHGQLWQSFVTQPAGALLALLTAIALIIGGYAALAGMSIKPLLRSAVRPRWFVLLGIAVAIAWAYKVAVTMTA